MITTIFAGDNARMVQSVSSNYNSALNGTNRTVENNSTFNSGQYRTNTGEYRLRQYFSEYNYVAPVGQSPVFAYWRFFNTQTWGTSVERTHHLRRFNYGSDVNTTDWRTPGALYSHQHIGGVNFTHNALNNKWVTIATNHLWREFESSNLVQTVLHTDRNQNGSTPSGHEQNTFRGVPFEGTSFDPQVVIGHTTEHSMSAYMCAQVQLSTGDWMVCERDSVGDRPWSMTIKRIDVEGVEHVIAQITLQGDENDDNMRGAQSTSMCRDTEDNVYVVDGNRELNEHFRIRVLRKTGEETWEALPNQFVRLPADNDRYDLVSVQAAFHDVAGGRLFIAGYRQHGAWMEPGGTHDPWTLVRTETLLGRSSSPLLVTSGAMGRNGYTSYSPMWGHPNPINPYGTLFDLYPDPTNPHAGYIVTAERHAQPGETAAISIGTYHVLSTGGNMWSGGIFAENDTGGGYSVHDPDAKARVIAPDNRRFVKIAVDDRPNHGITLDYFSVDLDNQSFTRLNSTKMDAEGIPSLPDGATLGTSSTWDAFYFDTDNNIWIYYFDDADPTRLMRTSYNVEEGLASRREVLVDDATVAATDTVHAIRVQRNEVSSDHVMISLAVEDDSGVHRTEYVIDWINIAPTQPVLNAVENYDAVEDNEFSWIFSDPNVTDEQTAYQVQFVDANTLNVEHDTGKVVSGDEFYLLAGNTLPNNEDYIWRVKVWDTGDYESPWSNYRDFSVSNTGIVSITFPSEDNEEIFIKDIPLTWSLVNSTQEEYRVVVTSVDDSEEFLDTGWVESSEQEHLVEDLLSDVQYLFQVTTRQSLVESNTAQRLVFTHYSTPETPVLSVDNFIREPYLSISVTNPEPRGDRPEVTVNEVWRRDLGDTGAFEYVGSTPINSTFRDYSVGSGEVYEYRVRGAVEA